MVNGYVDLGTYVGFTPYVGGGLGYTYIDWGTLSGSNFCVNGAAPVRPSAISRTTENDGEQSWRFTYAADGGHCLRRFAEPEDRPRLSLSPHRRRADVRLRCRIGRAGADRYGKATIPASHRTRSSSACATSSGRRLLSDCLIEWRALGPPFAFGAPFSSSASSRIAT